MTLENVIERILLTDIHDEKDRETARNLLRKATVMYRNQSDNTGNADDATQGRKSTYYHGQYGQQLGDTDEFRSKFVREYYNILREDI